MGRPDSRGVVEPGREVGCSSILDTGPPAGLYRLNPRILRLSLLSYSATNNGLLCRPFFSGSSCVSLALFLLFASLLPSPSSFSLLPSSSFVSLALFLLFVYLLPSSSSLSLLRSSSLPPACLLLLSSFSLFVLLSPWSLALNQCCGAVPFWPGYGCS